MKIAILGKTATRREAPFDNPAWTIWGVGTANLSGVIPLAGGGAMEIGRWDAWFECHGTRDYNDAQPRRDWREHWLWLKAQTKTIHTLGTLPVRAAHPLPREALLARFGAYFMQNTVAWAMAYALHIGADEIGLWGIDQAHSSEYERERHGVQHFIHLARALGVPVFLPERCLLREEPLPYPDQFEPRVIPGMEDTNVETLST